jgi:hypothetical protein
LPLLKRGTRVGTEGVLLLPLSSLRTGTSSLIRNLAQLRCPREAIAPLKKGHSDGNRGGFVVACHSAWNEVEAQNPSMSFTNLPLPLSS